VEGPEALFRNIAEVLAAYRSAANAALAAVGNTHPSSIVQPEPPVPPTAISQ
jgi:hypothetical protein